MSKTRQVKDEMTALRDEKFPPCWLVWEVVEGPEGRPYLRAIDQDEVLARRHAQQIEASGTIRPGPKKRAVVEPVRMNHCFGAFDEQHAKAWRYKREGD